MRLAEQQYELGLMELVQVRDRLLDDFRGSLLVELFRRCRKVHQVSRYFPKRHKHNPSSMMWKPFAQSGQSSHSSSLQQDPRPVEVERVSYTSTLQAQRVLVFKCSALCVSKAAADSAKRPALSG